MALLNGIATFLTNGVAIDSAGVSPVSSPAVNLETVADERHDMLMAGSSQEFSARTLKDKYIAYVISLKLFSCKDADEAIAKLNDHSKSAPIDHYPDTIETRNGIKKIKHNGKLTKAFSLSAWSATNFSYEMTTRSIRLFYDEKAKSDAKKAEKLILTKTVEGVWTWALTDVQQKAMIKERGLNKRKDDRSATEKLKADCKRVGGGVKAILKGKKKDAKIKALEQILTEAGCVNLVTFKK
jgi:hypothetical protein